MKTPSNLSGETYKWIFLIALLILVIVPMPYVTPAHWQHLQELYRAFFYIPIILAAFRFKLAGGLMTAVIVVIIYVPHMVFHWRGNYLDNFSSLSQMVMYLVFGSLTGILAQRQWRERKKYQDTAAELEHSYARLKRQAGELAEIEDQLLRSERLSVLGELTTSLAQEVRNPLDSILRVAEILVDKFNQEDKDTEFINILSQEVNRLNRVIESYLTLAKNPRLSLQPCNLKDIIESVLLLLSPKANKQKIKLESKFSGRLNTIKADENQLRQILINLVLNSIAAISNDGTITIMAGQRFFESRYHDGKNIAYMYVSVIDTGEGMTAETMEQMFKPFYSTRKDGTGLGLSIVKRIVDQNNWQIEVKSKPNQGSEITVVFAPEVIRGVN